MSAQRHKVLRIGFLVPARNLEPKAAHDVESSYVLRHIFEAPFGIEYGTTEIAPRLFKGPLKPGAGTDAYEAEVCDDAVFSDGTPLRPEDVVRCLRDAALVQQQADVRLEGDRVVFRLKRPNARFDLALSHAQCSIYRWAGAKLIGTGPYQLAETTPDVLRLTRNPHYRRKAVAIDEVEFRTYPPDVDGRATALLKAIEKGDVDLSLSLGRDDIDAVPGVRKVVLPGVSTAMLFMNGDNPRLKDRRVRQAIARAVDRLEVTKTSYTNPLAFVATSLTPRPLGPADDALSFDLAEARALLAKADSVPERLDMLLVWGPRPYLPYPHKVAELIREQIGRLGIRVEFHQPPSSTDYLKATVAAKQDLTLAGWIADTMDPCDFLDAALASDRIPQPDNLAVACNHGHLRSRPMDEALDRYRAERTTAHLEAIVDIVNHEAPLVPLMYGPAASVRSYRVENFKPTPLWFVPAEELDLSN